MRTRNSISARPTSWRTPRHPKVVAIGEAGLDYHYDNSPRDAQEQGFRAHIAAARETGLPLVIHSREADDDMARDSGGGNGEGGLPGRAALLHRRPRAGDARDRARALYVLHRHPDVQELAGPARHRGGAAGGPDTGRNRCAVSRARQVSRQAQRAGLCGRNRESPGADARRFAATRSRARPRRISSGCSAKCRARFQPPHDARHSPFSAAARPAACRGRRSAGAPAIRTIRRTAAGAARCWSSSHGRGGKTQRAGRHVAGPARAVARCRRQKARRRAVHP